MKLSKKWADRYPRTNIEITMTIVAPRPMERTRAEIVGLPVMTARASMTNNNRTHRAVPMSRATPRLSIPEPRERSAAEEVPQAGEDSDDPAPRREEGRHSVGDRDAQGREEHPQEEAAEADRRGDDDGLDDASEHYDFPPP